MLTFYYYEFPVLEIYYMHLLVQIRGFLLWYSVLLCCASRMGTQFPFFIQRKRRSGID